MEMQKTIGIDARFLGDAGPGRYVKNIVENLENLDTKNNYVIFLREKGFDSYQPHNLNFKKVLADYHWYTFEEQLGYLRVLLEEKLDLYYVPHFNIPVLYPKKLVTAIPDLIMHTYSTERGTTLPKLYFKFKKIVYRMVVLWAVIRSKRVIVPSNDVMSDFKKLLPFVNEKKYVLAYEGVDPVLLSNDSNEDVLTKLNIQKPYILFISSMYEHKNVTRLLTAFKILKEKYGYAGQLVLVGKKDNFSKSYSELSQKLGLSDSVKFPGLDNYVTDSETLYLRKNADMYVFPSLKEGFSLTPLEAQSLGLVCAISDIPCHREIYEDSVLYFDPYDEEHMALKIETLLKSPRLKDELIQRGFEQVKKYSWVSTAEITFDVIKEALGQNP